MRRSDAQGRKIHVALALPVRLGNAEPPMPPLLVSGKKYPCSDTYLDRRIVFRKNGNKVASTGTLKQKGGILCIVWALRVP